MLKDSSTLAVSVLINLSSKLQEVFFLGIFNTFAADLVLPDS